MPSKTPKVRERGASGRPDDDFRLSFDWKSIPNSSIKLLELIKGNDEWRQTMFPPAGIRFGTRQKVLRAIHIAFCAKHAPSWLQAMRIKGYVECVDGLWGPTEKWNPIQVMTVPTEGHLTRMKVKLFETIKKYGVSPEWKKWQDVPAARRDALRELCPHLFVLRTLLAQSLDAEITAPASHRSTAPGSTTVVESRSAKSLGKRPRNPPSGSTLLEALDTSAESSHVRPRAPAPPSNKRVQSVSRNPKKRKHDPMAVIVVSDDSDEEAGTERGEIKPKQRPAPRPVDGIREGKSKSERRKARRSKKRAA